MNVVELRSLIGGGSARRLAVCVGSPERYLGSGRQLLCEILSLSFAPVVFAMFGLWAATLGRAIGGIVMAAIAGVCLRVCVHWARFDEVISSLLRCMVADDYCGNADTAVLGEHSEAN